MKRVFIYTLFISLSLFIKGQVQLASSIDSLINTLPQQSEVGIAIYDLTTREMLYTYRADKLSRPASTMKLLTTITALSLPQGNQPFRTEVWCRGVVENDTLHGDLYVVGGMDPEFDDVAMNALISQVRALPFTSITGMIHGDVTLKDSLYWGSGWAWDDNPESFQPYLSPLMFSKGTVTISATPGATRGDTAYIVATPASSYYSLRNESETRHPSSGRFSINRDWLNNKNEIVVKGNIEQRQGRELNLFSSKDFFMHTFVERLSQQGIQSVQGYGFEPFIADSLSQLIASYDTPFQIVINKLLKDSDNLNAEALFCRIGALGSGKPYVAATDGATEVNQLIKRLGHNPEHYKVVDGSGLSNYNYLSPALLVDFLKYAYSDTSIFGPLYKALPTAGIDGTLKHRMKLGRAYRNVHAKTGSFTAINALAGYAKAVNGHDIAFAIMNQNILTPRMARSFQDKVCELICNY